MTNKTYDILKYVAQIVLPALGTLYFALAGIWGFPYGEQIVGTLAAIDAFLGAVLKLSSDKYYKDGKDTVGTVTIDPVEETADFDFNDLFTPEALAAMKQVKVKVEAYQEKH